MSVRMKQKKHSVLVVDDDEAMREMLGSILEEAGIAAVEAASASAALQLFQEREFSAVLSDIRMPGKSGLELLGELHKLRPEIPVLLMTAFGSVDLAVEAMQEGAYHYVTKPFKRKEILLILNRAFEHSTLEEENRKLRRAVDHTSMLGDLIGESAAMRDIFALIRKIANNRSNVLLTGESGTGKEVVARTIHYVGARAEQPFVPINCTALPEGLLESELFGHVRGAFTGAHATKKGLFEHASGGTIFLDEIGDMSLALQSKLLRVLQDQEIRPVGGNQAVQVDVRVITATNRNLEKDMDEGRFRRDLFYRLNVIPIQIPPLRERPEDIRVLSEFFLRKHCGNPQVRLAPAALAKLETARWEGNARELENAIERAVALTDGVEIGAEDFPFLKVQVGVESAPTPLREENILATALTQKLTLHELEDLYISEILKFTHGNKVRAAKILGINRRTLYRRGSGSTQEGVDPDREDSASDSSKSAKLTRVSAAR